MPAARVNNTFCRTSLIENAWDKVFLGLEVNREVSRSYLSDAQPVEARFVFVRAVVPCMVMLCIYAVCLGLLILVLLAISMIFVLRNFNLGLKEKG